MGKVVNPYTSSVIRQQGKSQRVLQENNARQIFRKTNIFYPLMRTSGSLGCIYFFCRTIKSEKVRVRIKSKKCLFFGKFDMVCFLVTLVLSFALLPYYRRHLIHHRKCNTKAIESNSLSMFSMCVFTMCVVSC